MKPTRFREDGWPLCPVCGEDELGVFGEPSEVWSLPELERLVHLLKKPMYCHRCARNTVEAGEAAETKSDDTALAIALTVACTS